jgi:hypothetical protein
MRNVRWLKTRCYRRTCVLVALSRQQSYSGNALPDAPRHVTNTGYGKPKPYPKAMRHVPQRQ